jgi:hypothetical protein
VLPNASICEAARERPKRVHSPKIAPTVSAWMRSNPFYKPTCSVANNEQFNTKTNPSLIRYALEIKDQHLAQVVRRVEAGEMIIDHLYVE